MSVRQVFGNDDTFEVVDNRTGKAYRIARTDESVGLLSVLVKGGRFIVRQLPRTIVQREKKSRMASTRDLKQRVSEV